MACGCRKGKGKLVARQTREKFESELPVASPPDVHDFHCGDCGFTRPRKRESYDHLCSGKRDDIPYQVQRRDKCSSCDQNHNGICAAYKRLYPDRDCVIEVGIRMEFAACPIGKWAKQILACPECGYKMFIADGVPEVCPNKKCQTPTPLRADLPTTPQ